MSAPGVVVVGQRSFRQGGMCAADKVYHWIEVIPMKAPTYERILREAERLSPQEQSLLIKRLAERLQESQSAALTGPRWEDQAGSAPYPLCGEDAQAWVNRTRQESDEERNIL